MVNLSTDADRTRRRDTWCYYCSMAKRGRDCMPELSPPQGLTAAYFVLGSERLSVVSYPVEADAADLRPLTPALRDVLERLLLGRSNEQIARARDTATRTVANQVSKLLRIFGVASRTDLAGAVSMQARPSRLRPELEH